MCLHVFWSMTTRTEPVWRRGVFESPARNIRRNFKNNSSRSLRIKYIYIYTSTQRVIKYDVYLNLKFYIVLEKKKTPLNLFLGLTSNVDGVFRCTIILKFVVNVVEIVIMWSWYIGSGVLTGDYLIDFIVNFITNRELHLNVLRFAILLSVDRSSIYSAQRKKSLSLNEAISVQAIN